MVILVTGATAGFGKAIALRLLAQGHQVIGTGRRLEKLQELSQAYPQSFTPLVFDLQDRQATEQALASLSPELRNNIDVLVNNAGLAKGLDPAYKADFADWQTMIDTNVVGLVSLTNLVLPTMVKNHRGYIINLGSIAGTYPYPGGNIYGATKAFVRQFSLNLRADLAGTGVRVTNLEPGLCGDTEFSQVRFRGDLDKAAQVYANIDYVTPEDIADIVSYLIHLPAHVNVNSLEVMPTAQTFNPLRVDTKDFKVE
ncbi:NADP-dependent 3-hydroxy acid dehydrogenase [Psittacicella melopsittaci]|uniref:NADP-dependent 3-hydroxy acid dehydrogenase n=1 Tax=Psittacicella melopsittaci TaxID=2028576 RepID=A0A3A1Y8D7_9GAMM|nr:SDR family NAD(P)-dependent oxidoreductase [Psittacicella melopsittaci]RIY33576.1 NADP-dependent 3-hydroxy acid dehydrogenase [Psittacicella melopsittaci]